MKIPETRYSIFGIFGPKNVLDVKDFVQKMKDFQDSENHDSVFILNAKILASMEAAITLVLQDDTGDIFIFHLALPCIPELYYYNSFSIKVK